MVQQTQNAHAAERAISVASGVLLMLPTLKKRSTLRVAAATAGGVLVYRGLSAHRPADETAGLRAIPSHRRCLRQSITVDKPASELYALWRNPDVLTKVMRSVAEVSPLGEDHARWCIHLPAGRELAWETAVVDNQPDSLIHFSSFPDSDFDSEMWIRLRPAPQNRGTEVSMEFTLDFSRLPGGTLIQSVFSHFRQGPQVMASKVLRDFKSLAETGEMPTLERNPSGRWAHDRHRKGDRI